jgi:hypothetical protein
MGVKIGVDSVWERCCLIWFILLIIQMIFATFFPWHFSPVEHQWFGEK